MNIWFTSDHHFGHKNINKLANRPFYSLPEMEEALVEKWNSVVKNTDTVFYLGDFCLGGRRDAEKWISRLNGQIYFMKGNHDDWFKKLPFVNYLDAIHVLTHKDKKYVLCHYPMISWEGSFNGAIHLHGHTHGNIGEVGISEEPGSNGIRVDVGVDSWGYSPVSIDTVSLFSSIMTKQRERGIKNNEIS